jgi:hypothetical protein
VLNQVRIASINEALRQPLDQSNRLIGALAFLIGEKSG